MPVVDYAASTVSSRKKRRALWTALAACLSLGACLVMTFPAVDTAQWLERAHHYNVNGALIAQVEMGQRRNIALSLAAWLIAGAGWAVYLYRRGLRRAWRIRARV